LQYLTALVSFCGLNLKKHKPILEDIEYNGLIEKREATIGKRTITIYRPTQKGMAFCRDILEPYEKMFPRIRIRLIINNSIMSLLVLI
jgi:predicted transcriptional regulator